MLAETAAISFCSCSWRYHRRREEKRQFWQVFGPRFKLDDLCRNETWTRECDHPFRNFKSPALVVRAHASSAFVLH